MPPQTVTFPCPFCGRRMGVPAELLGKQVRCPHCKQVVLAPLTAAPSGVVPAVNLPPAPPLPSILPPPVAPAPQPITESEFPQFAPRREGTDSILGDPGESEDEVFPQSQIGRRIGTAPPLDLTNPAPPAPKTESPFEFAGTTATTPGLPSGPQRPVPPNGPAHGPSSDLPNPFLELEPVTLPTAFGPPPSGPKPTVPTPAIETQPYPAPAPAQAPVRPAFGGPLPVPVVPAPAPADPFANIDVSISQSVPPSVTEDLDGSPRRRRPRRDEKPAPAPEEKPPRSGRTRPLPPPPASGNKVILYVVIGYAVLATGVAIWGLLKPSVPADHPLYNIPDTFGEFEPALRKKVTQYKFPVDGELPPQQRARLGTTIDLAQIEVRPVKIETRPLVVEPPGDRKPPAADALVLTLTIKNTSSDLTFHPMDPAFTRRTTLGGSGARDDPATRLVIDKKAHTGGYLSWPDEPGRRRIEKDQAEDAKPLGPGQTRNYVVFTDPTRPDILNAVRGTKEDMQWRVQVRRGSIDYNGREVPVTAIIGVDFRTGDIRFRDAK